MYTVLLTQVELYLSLMLAQPWIEGEGQRK